MIRKDQRRNHPALYKISLLFSSSRLAGVLKLSQYLLNLTSIHVPTS